MGCEEMETQFSCTEQMQVGTVGSPTQQSQAHKGSRGQEDPGNWACQARN